MGKNSQKIAFFPGDQNRQRHRCVRLNDEIYQKNKPDTAASNETSHFLMRTDAVLERWMTKENQCPPKKPAPRAILCTTNPTLATLGLNWDSGGDEWLLGRNFGDNYTID